MIDSRERLLSEQLPVLREKHAAESGWKQDVSNRLESQGWRFSGEPDGAKSLSGRTGARSLQSERVKQNPGETQEDFLNKILENPQKIYSKTKRDLK
ncbi:MAG: hypothetical protein AB7E31_03845 [Desulfitobacterium sp.]